MTKILNRAQAKAVYDAMCALNNVGGNLRVAMHSIIVQESSTGTVLITHFKGPREGYPSQAAFAEAYGVQ